MQFSKNFSATTRGDRAAMGEGLYIEHLLTDKALLESELTLGSDVVAGLSQTLKSLPPKYFYDDHGSELFEQICELPEYYLTRTEASILQHSASAIAKLTGNCEIVELGSGSSTKTRILLTAYAQSGYPLRYLPIDVSAGILESSARELIADYPALQVHAIASTYEQALEKLGSQENAIARKFPQRLFCFLGSTLGNLNPAECDRFFAQVVAAMQPGDFFLIGIDLHKSAEILEPAYNDAQGVTAAFNLNMLRHLNWRFEGNFNLDHFEHHAFYNQELHQIEMHLRSTRSQIISLNTLDFTVELKPGETILTEISRKFDCPQMQQYLDAQKLHPLEVYRDPQNWFALLLCQRQ